LTGRPAEVEGKFDVMQAPPARIEYRSSPMKDKVIVVTGASAGIGAALAESLGKKGARPVLVARREKELRDVATRCGPTALVIVGDVTRRSDLENVVKAAIERFGGIDVWVNNAGRGISRMPSELTDADIDAMMLVNFKGMMYGMQAALPHFKERGQGHLINVSTMLARMPLAPIRSAYAASKAALNSLSSSLRRELRATYPDIAVTVVHPGVVATDFGLNALHGGVDNKKLPGAQDVGEVAAVLVDVIEHPKAEVYTRPGAQQMVASYYAAEDMGAVEENPPFGPLRR
jgi:short-subunit dehydrogenase